MNKLLGLAFFLLMVFNSHAQSFELSPLQDSYKGTIGEIIKAPLRVKNTSDKPLILVIRRITAQIGGTQKNYLCLDQNCLDQRIDDHTIRLEPGQTSANLHAALEGGLTQGLSIVKYLIINKLYPSETMELDVNFMVEEKVEKEKNIYASPYITLHDVYPNPVTENAFANYTLLDDRIKAKIVIHNILGNTVDEYLLSGAENKVKIRTESLNAGIYFYTLYIDNEGVITRKLIIKK